MMKKFFCILLSITLICLLGLTSCSNGDGSNDDSTEHVHVYADATCKEMKKCSCGQFQTSELAPHTFQNGVCSVCNKTLIDELGALVTYDNDKIREDFDVIEDSQDYTKTKSVVIETYTDLPNDSWLGVKLTLSQDGFKSGVYEWTIQRNILKEYAEQPGSYYYEESIITGTVKAADFPDSNSLTFVETTGNTPFTQSEISDYMSKAHQMLKEIIQTKLARALSENQSDFTVADYGFEKIQ